MRKLVIALAALLGLAIATSSRAEGAAHWTRLARCTATTASLTCTGRAGGVQPQFIAGLGAVQAGITGDIHYACSDPVFETVFSGFPPDAPGSGYFAETDFHNGHPFTVQFSPPSVPPGLGAQILCTSGQWTRDPVYYNVRVAVGWGFGSYSPLEGLDASIGTVSPG
jgi:hypothetical protein